MSTNFISTDYPFLGKDEIDEFLWLVILGGFVCFAMAWGIGANDVANAFGTSVGSRAINLKQAAVIAGIFEFVGAVGLGATVTKTVRKGIVNFDLFEGEEDILLLGMFCALLSAALWLILATKYALPVSTTQSIVGAIAGFALAAKGVDAINWVGHRDEHGNLEKYNGILFIAVFWIASPFFAAIGSVLFFLPIRNLLLRRADSYKQIMRFWPVFVFVVAFIMALFLIIKGFKRLDFDYSEQLGLSFLITTAVAIGVSMLAYFALVRTGAVDRYVHKSLGLTEDESNGDSPHSAVDKAIELAAKKTDENDNEMVAVEVAVTTSAGATAAADAKIAGKKVEVGSGGLSKRQLLLKRAAYGVNVDIHDDLGELETAIRDNAEKFDVKTDKAFAWLQVCTASLGIFAHGSNDVANAVAPFAAMIGLYMTGEAQKEVSVPEWVLVIGAVGMVVGLSTYGYKVMRCLGVRMAPMTCSRGYSIELSSSLVVIMASVYGFPTSTTHAQVGATVGIGLMELNRPDSKLRIGQVVNWKLLMQVLFGWVLTLVVAGFTSAALFSFMAYSPYYGNVTRAD